MTTIVPFTDDHVPAAAALLAGRHRAARLVEPALAQRYEAVDVVAAEIVALLESDRASGAAALVGARVDGFLLGTRRDDAVWGPNVWVEAAGHAVAPGRAELARDLYAAAATRWVEEGRTAHYALLPAGDGALVDAWFRLVFGLQHVHALREVATQDERATPPGVVVRPAARGDVPDLARLELELPAHQARSPVFSAGSRPSLADAQAAWEADVDDHRFATFVAARDGVVVGCAIGCALGLSSLHRGLCDVDDAGFLGFAAVEPGARGRGVGGALLDAVHGWARREGHAVLVTDWRAANLLASRTWTRRGFRPTFVRVHRAVGW
jgi:GNAT superfamily N-acetyltransferase